MTVNLPDALYDAAVSSTALYSDSAAARLSLALSQWQAWRFSEGLVRVGLYGEHDQCWLELVLRLPLLKASADEQAQLSAGHLSVLVLRSERFDYARPWPPAIKPVAPADPAYADDAPLRGINPDDPLCYQLVQLEPEAHGEGEHTSTASADEHAPAHRSSLQPLKDYLQAWLQRQGLNHIEGALRYITQGAIGPMGRLRPYVLSRSQQADLKIEATLLAQHQHKNKSLRTQLRLFAERHGKWVLQRSVTTTHTQIKQRQGETEQTQHQTTEHQVLIADTPEQLQQLSGLGEGEKTLYQQAGLLAHDELWAELKHATSQPHHHTDGTDSLDSHTDLSASALLNLSGLDVRSIRSLTRLVQLAQKAKLGSTELDLLYKLAQKLAKT